METISQSSQLAIQIRKELEQVLRKHIRRLAGEGHELREIFFSLDTLTLSSTVLLVEREKEIKESKDTVERYNEETLMFSLAELGLDNEKDLKRTLQEMTQKDYFSIKSNGDLVAEELALKLSDLINQIFPNMPDISLIVYFNQILDEILSGRKTTGLAVAQIDKTLQTQGVSQVEPQGKPKHKPKTEGKLFQPKKRPLIPLAGPKTKRLSGLDRLKKAAMNKQASDGSGKKILSGGKWITIDEPKEEVVEEEVIEEEAPVIEEKSPNLPPATNEIDISDILSEIDNAKNEKKEEIQAPLDPQNYADMFLGNKDLASKAAEELEHKPKGIEIHDETQDFSQPSIDQSLSEPEEKTIPNQNLDPQSYADQLTNQFFSKVDAPEITETVEIEKPDIIETPEETIEKHIQKEPEEHIHEEPKEKFDCPTCHKKSVIEMETGLDKKYFVCKTEDCNFVSWGKPHNIVCPECGNTYLVEKQQGDEVIYDCPITTCSHSQKDLIQLPPIENEAPEPPKKKKRLVRRVVRRKK